MVIFHSYVGLPKGSYFTETILERSLRHQINSFLGLGSTVIGIEWEYNKDTCIYIPNTIVFRIAVGLFKLIANVVLKFSLVTVITIVGNPIIIIYTIWGWLKTSHKND